MKCTALLTLMLAAMPLLQPRRHGYSNVSELSRLVSCSSPIARARVVSP
jgi:hypothetical protein